MAANLTESYLKTRRDSEELCKTLQVEDYVVQAMPDASPTRWHLAHTTWFFETFVLAPAHPARPPVDPAYQILFNSYYNSVGEQFPRPRRGLLTRPTVADVYSYRRTVDRRMTELLQALGSDRAAAAVRDVVELGIQHEQQHQELIVTDLKYLFSCNPLHPVYRETDGEPRSAAGPGGWSAFSGGIAEIGFEGRGFSFDNERPRHKALIAPFEIQNQLTTAGEFLEFMRDGGYERPEFWLSLGWATKNEQGWKAPLYWIEGKAGWDRFTLNGLKPLRRDEPVSHVSYFEADAFARWAGARLPTESEWEHVAAHVEAEGEEGDGRIEQFSGDVWQWTASPYTPYPGYHAAAGALGEYNGKFMCNQYVLRGGSCATPAGHSRRTYRNFFPPDARWQFTGFRLARDIHE